jgi:tetratricopeptide (TPR) repeat protein
MRSITETKVDRTLRLVLDRAARQRKGREARRIDALFRELGTDDPIRDPDEIMELIWAMWIDHPDGTASATLIAAVEAIQQGARDLARPMLDRLVREYPDWAEAWNKRATLAYIERRDGDSLEDIARTLELEPRHLGAILGFGQICMRHRRLPEAKAAFEVALGLNPHLHGLSDLVSDLSARPAKLH